MDDFFGFGKVLPIDKLIDVLSNVTGRLSKSYFDKKDIDTKAYEKRTLAIADAEAMKIISDAVKESYLQTGGIEYKENNLTIISPKELPTEICPVVLITPSLEERTKDRLDFKEGKKQLNIENVTAYAAEELKNEKSVTDEPLDEDWTTRFFSIAEEISSDEMQALWGRILAGEIKQPKSYSLRTLELLKNLSKEEAELFTKFANIKLISNGTNFIFNPDDGNFLKDEFNITFSNRLLLKELGLIASENNLELSFIPTNKSILSSAFLYGNKAIIFHRGEDTPKQGIEVLVFTKAGTELSKFIQQTININYIEKICSSFKNPTVKIEYGDVVNMPNGQMMLFNKVEYDK